MTLHEELAKANVPGARVRAALIKKGIEAERQRILAVLDKFWCQEIACSKHPVRMDWIIKAIKEIE